MARSIESELLAKYPQMIPGTLRYDAALNKQFAQVTLECGCVKELATSDMFQVKECAECRARRKAERMAELKATWAAQHAEALERKAAKKAAKIAEREARKLKTQNQAA